MSNILLTLSRVQSLDNNTQAFFALVRAGLWETEVQLSPYGDIDFKEIYRLAKEQSVVGLLAAGLEHVVDLRPSKDIALAIARETLQLEQRNIAMNAFTCQLVNKVSCHGIQAVLIKGQGVAQCYERPLWRTAGDVDFLLNSQNYSKASVFFDKVANGSGDESNKDKKRLHREYHISQWIVELHGTMHAGLGQRIDRVIDDVQNDVFVNSGMRIWNYDNTEIVLPSPDNDIVLVFTHILQHFFVTGIGLRQVCDLCRLLWTFRDVIKEERLYRRLIRMGVLSEWKAFGSLMVDQLGAQQSSIPFYDQSFQKKGRVLLSYIMKDGNFGKNRDYSHFTKYPVIVRRLVTFWKQFLNTIRNSRLFPLDAPRFFMRFVMDGIKH